MLVLYTAKLDFLQMERYFVSIQSKWIVLNVKLLYKTVK